MKYIKLFENWNSEVFYRMTQRPEGDGAEEFEITQSYKEHFWGSSIVSEFLTKKGYPNQRKSVNFMDAVAFSEYKDGFKNVYGENKYNIKIDDNYHLGWSYELGISDIFYKFDMLKKYLNLTKDSITYQKLENIGHLNCRFVFSYKSYDELEENEKEVLETIYEFLVSECLIGQGTIDDLKSSPLWSRYKLFGWTEGKVLFSKYKEPIIDKPKVDLTNKKLTTNDYKSTSVSPDRISQFVKYMGLKMKTLSREELLSHLRDWSGN